MRNMVSKQIPIKPTGNPTSTKEWIICLCDELAKIKGDTWYVDNKDNLKSIMVKLSSLDASSIKIKDINNVFVANNVEDCLNEIKKYVEDGKKIVSSAITSKGISTPSNASFKTMGDNIRKIKVGYSQGDTIPNNNFIINYNTVYKNSFSTSRIIDVDKYMKSYETISQCYVNKSNVLYAYTNCNGSALFKIIRLNTGSVNFDKYVNNYTISFLFYPLEDKVIYSYSTSSDSVITCVESGSTSIGNTKTFSIGKPDESWGMRWQRFVPDDKDGVGIFIQFTRGLSPYKTIYYRMKPGGTFSSEYELNESNLQNTSWSFEVTNAKNGYFYTIENANEVYINKRDFYDGSLVDSSVVRKLPGSHGKSEHAECIYDDNHIIYSSSYGEVRIYNYIKDTSKYVTGSNFHILSDNIVAVINSPNIVYYKYECVNDDIVLTEISRQADVANADYRSQMSNDLLVINNKNVLNLYSRDKTTEISSVTLK